MSVADTDLMGAREDDAPPLSEQFHETAKTLIARYPVARERSALLPMLYLAQAEHGYVSRRAIREIAALLGLTPAEVAAVASFYTMFKRRPQGRWLVSVCTQPSCALAGGQVMADRLQAELGIACGETTPDGAVSLEDVECLCACDGAPVFSVNYENYERMTPDGAIAMIRSLREGTAPPPGARDVTPPDFAETNRVMAAGGRRAPDPDGPRAAPRAPRGAGPAETKVITARFDTPGADTIDGYLASGGYEALRKALTMTPDEIIELVKQSGLRGRGGAGFPTGTKWSFIPKDVRPAYLVCNADEGEPGTFKDRELMERDPHQMLEGMAIGAHAIGSNEMYVYCRGEFAYAARVLERAIAEAYDRGFLGRGVLGSGFDLECVLHRGAGAYICGEETALLESLEGRRGQPRLRPPFPATHGLYAKPTVVNNVETFACVPHIILKGAEWFKGLGTEKSPGTKIFSVSGDVERPGNYEVPFGTTARDLISGFAGGVSGGKQLKAFTPGGASSTPFFGPDSLDTPMDWEEVQAAGSMLGTGAIIVFAEDACMVRAALRYTRFYAHESCGKCTPCREGTFWLERMLERFERGEGREEDVAIANDVCRNIIGRSFCALGDFAVAPVTSTTTLWLDEYKAHIAKGCPYER